MVGTFALITFGTANGAGASGRAAALGSSTWSEIPPGPLSVRVGQTSLWTGSKLLIWGGVTAGNCPCGVLGDGALYDPATQRWSIMAPSPLRGRYGQAAVWTGHSALIWGGGPVPGSGANQFVDLNDGALYNTATNTWSRLPRSPLSPRTDAAAFWTGRVVIIFGGAGPPPNALFLSDGATYDPTTHAWGKLPPLPTRAHRGRLQGSSAAWTGRQLLAWTTFETTVACSPPEPGETCIKRSYMADVWQPGWSSWKRLPVPPFDPAVATAYSSAGRIVVLTGQESGPLTTTSHAEILDPSTGRWRESLSSPVLIDGSSSPAASTGGSVVVINSRTEMGNGSGTTLTPGDGVLIDPRSGTLESIPVAPVGVGYDSGTSLVWTGRTLLVWGADTKIAGRPETVLALQLG